MKVSVITVTLNNLEGLKRTTDSVKQQGELDFEYVILDGGSTDGTVPYLSTLPSSWVIRSEADSGIYNAMNKAVRMAHGEYCIFMNAGDTFYDDSVLRKVLPILDGTDFFVGHTLELGPNHRLEGYAPDTLTAEYLATHSIYHQSTFIRRELLLQHPYNEQHRIVSDWEFVFRRWLYGSTYRPLNFFVSIYYLGGYSFIHQDLIEVERKEVISQLPPDKIIESFKPQSRLEKVIARSKTLKPVKRDLKILKYAFKQLIKDMF